MGRTVFYAAAPLRCSDELFRLLAELFSRSWQSVVLVFVEGGANFLVADSNNNVLRSSSQRNTTEVRVKRLNHQFRVKLQLGNNECGVGVIARLKHHIKLGVLLAIYTRSIYFFASRVISEVA